MDDIPKSQITRLLHNLSEGDEHALDKLLPIVYKELRKIASKYLSKEYRKGLYKLLT